MKMLGYFMSVLVTLILSFSAHAESVYRWKNVGGDPCNPRAGCTLQWALQQTGWPLEVQRGLVEVVRSKYPERIVIRSGWKGWMTWGEHRPRFHPNTLADWPQGHSEPAERWFYRHGADEYELVRVRRCKNWGGRKVALTRAELRPGGIPQAGCP